MLCAFRTVHVSTNSLAWLDDPSWRDEHNELVYQQVHERCRDVEQTDAPGFVHVSAGRQCQ